MPKIIDNLKDDIIKCSKDLLFKDGYEELTMRKIASTLKVALGTLYNYFPSKELIVATIMLEDWNVAKEKMKMATDTADSISAIQVIYSAIFDFSNKYFPVWSEYKGNPITTNPDKHQMIVGDVKAYINSILDKFDLNFDSYLSEFLSEAILRNASTCKDFNLLVPILRKLL